MTTASDITLPALLGQLSELDVGAVKARAPLAHHCSWRIGGPADLLVEPESAMQVARLVGFAREHEIPLLVIGQGTNLLFDDAGLRGIVLKVGARMAQLSIHGNRILAEAGVWVPQLARQAARNGLTGLEHIIGIPGTLGGLVLMNGGSHRRGIGDNVRRVWVIDRAGELQVLSHAQCAFSYRHSALQDSGAVVVRAELECSTGDPRAIRRAMVCDLRERRRKFPRKEPNCGSVFLSTAEMHASVGPPGKIIEEAGLKGTRIGNAEVSLHHANFIVNRGGASAAEVLALIAHIRREVHERIGFELRCEVRYVDPQGRIMPADQAPQVRSSL
ncbi:UDP-N-acetylmuramate dehydrogenase [Geoalkalibacter ferrihydriticus]|uniref:UDP-N-acetylenolpyruvoylglucosamine reductase n=1 Tax=Geoalkalibacter ferrihydriticus TaxID=392333 RepID=A0A1G9SG67_9BACT|nr:UDP-N-acetylmuramate dehydrogenase [Geoalkalibacter ferrihydriticus]SDM34484.1 UDP-N-acetylmuramate dehydrogenase [Geoalkalibacter ferrihydriticus]